MAFPSTVSGQLPGFGPNSALPPGDYAPDRSDFESRFVRVPSSSTRVDIYGGWNRHRAALLQAGLPANSRQLLDGSFTTAKLSPGDLDLAVEVSVTSADYDSLSSATPVMNLLTGSGMKSDFRCDAYPILVLPASHSDYDTVTLQAISYWLKWFGKARDGSAKGRVWATVGGLS